jgi:hypothetical protein
MEQIENIKGASIDIGENGALVKLKAWANLNKDNIARGCICSRSKVSCRRTAM